MARATNKWGKLEEPKYAGRRLRLSEQYLGDELEVNYECADAAAWIFQI